MGRIVAAGALVVAGLGVAVAAQAQGGGPAKWSSYQGNMDHSGYVDMGLAPTINVRQRWRIEPPRLSKGVAIGYGQVFISSGNSFEPSMSLTARDLATGQARWSVDFGSVFSVNPPALDDNGTVFLVTGNHADATFLRSYAAETGQPRWQTALSAQWERYLAPTIVGDDVATNSGYYGGLSSVRRDGTLRYFTALPQYDAWTPTPWRGYWLSYTNRFDWVDRATGQVVATVTPSHFWNGYAVGQAPVVLQDRAFVTNGGRLIGIDLVNRSVALYLPISAVGQVSCDGQSLYVVSDGSVSVRSATGESLYTIQIPEVDIYPPLILTRTHLIANVGPVNGSPTQIAFIDLASRAVVRTLPWTGELALAADTLLVLGSDGMITAYDAPDTPFADGMEAR